MQSGYVDTLQIQRSKGASPEAVLSMELIEGKGIAGDCHFGEAEKQIALISSEVKLEMSTKEAYGLCETRFHENIETIGIEYSLLAAGDILTVGKAAIIISSCGKRCFLECPRFREGASCALKTGTAFAKVIHSGRINTGDKIWKSNGCH